MRVQPREAYRLWAPTYDSTDNPLLLLEERLLSGLLPEEICGTVVDIGCGTGRGMIRFRKSEVFGIDASEEMLREGLRKGLRGRLVVADVSALPLRSGLADWTICSFVASYFADADSAFAEMVRITKPTGRIVISDIHPEAISRGWTRSFRANGIRYEIEQSSLSSSDRKATLRRAGFERINQLDAGFSEHERPIFTRAGKTDLMESAYSVPAVRIAVYGRA